MENIENVLDLKVDDRDESSIQKSFDELAKKIINEYAIRVDKELCCFTEIEFYYFKKNVHEDNATHKHDFNSNRWRHHNYGLDITFQSNETSDGGILIRGLKFSDGFINGPIKILKKIFRIMGDINQMDHKFGVERLAERLIGSRKKAIIKTFRQGISEKTHNRYKDSYYRYLTDLPDLDIEESLKNKINQNHSLLENLPNEQ